MVVNVVVDRALDLRVIGFGDVDWIYWGLRIGTGGGLL
jgi:hypothetical protein